jgi:hypothetical protein
MISIHGVCLSRACLSVGKAGHFSSLEGTLHQRSHAFGVDLSVGSSLVHGLVEPKEMLIHIASEVNFESTYRMPYFCYLTMIY